MATLTTKKIAEKVGLTAKEFLEVLNKIEYVVKTCDTNEYWPTGTGLDFGELKEKDDFTYIIWDEEILNDKILKKELEKLSPKKEEEKIVVENRKLLTITEIASLLDVEPVSINKILVEIGYSSQLGKGYNSNNPLSKQFLFKDVPYLKWYKELLDDIVFMREVKILQEKKIEFNKESLNNLKKETEEALKKCKEKEEKEEKEEKIEQKVITGEQFKFDRKTFAAEFRTQSGHFVRSRGEVIVADWLYNNDIMFAYEKRLPIVEEMYSDFFIKKGKVYIEVWGLESTKYLERKIKKIELYAKYGFTLIGLDDKDIQNIDDFLPLKLAQAGIML